MSRPTQVSVYPGWLPGYGALTLCGAPFQTLPRASPGIVMTDPITPARASRHRRFGLLPVRSPLLGESLLLSSPAATKMFQFAAFASLFPSDAGIAPGGLPHSDILRSKGICPSLRLFAACHVLPRLREPRHPPCALVSLRNSFLRQLPHVAFSVSSTRSKRSFALLFSLVFLAPRLPSTDILSACGKALASIMSLCSPW